jgi:undecaprenyl-diphosphatase
MNDFISALIIAVVQGITEWLPISSSGHIVIFKNLLQYKSPGLIFDVALHFGTLMAVFVYFGKDIVDILQDLFRLKFKSENGRLGVLLIISSIPAGIAGILFNDFFESIFSSLIVTAMGFAITGIFLFIASIDINVKKKKISYLDSFLIGLAQAIAIIPGISRSGSTISTGLILGLNEKTAMKFSFLMAIPVILGANILEIGNNKLPSDLIWATLTAFVVGLITIHILFKYILTTKKNLRWFALYALLLSVSLMAYLFFFK